MVFEIVRNRLTSGSGMIGAGAYIAFQARSNTNRWARLVMNGVALGRFSDQLNSTSCKRYHHA